MDSSFLRSKQIPPPSTFSIGSLHKTKADGKGQVSVPGGETLSRELSKTLGAPVPTLVTSDLP